MTSSSGLPQTDAAASASSSKKPSPAFPENANPLFRTGDPEPNSTNASARSSARDPASPARQIHSPEHEQKRPRNARPLPGGATPGPATPTGWLLRGAYYPTHPAPHPLLPDYAPTVRAHLSVTQRCQPINRPTVLTPLHQHAKTTLLTPFPTLQRPTFAEAPRKPLLNLFALLDACRQLRGLIGIRLRRLPAAREKNARPEHHHAKPSTDRAFSHSFPPRGALPPFTPRPRRVASGRGDSHRSPPARARGG